MKLAEIIESLNISDIEEVIQEMICVLEEKKVNTAQLHSHFQNIKNERFYLNKKTGDFTKAVNKLHAKNQFGVGEKDVVSFNHIINLYMKGNVS